MLKKLNQISQSKSPKQVDMTEALCDLERYLSIPSDLSEFQFEQGGFIFLKNLSKFNA